MHINELKLTIEEVYELIQVVKPYTEGLFDGDVDEDLLSAYNKLSEVEYKKTKPNYNYEIPEFVGIVKEGEDNA